jgi:3-deoxy-D-manno-octulosonic-acid transferase
MLFFYNILQFIILFFCWPLIVLVVLAKPKYRKRIPERLGWRWRRLIGPSTQGKKTIWIHALSVGEVTSAMPLVRGLRADPTLRLIFSVTTQSGAQLAQKTIAPHVDGIVPFPIDFLPVVRHFITAIQPDLFLLVETDFWPNLLLELVRKKIPAILVNGRISQKSMDSYHRFGFFFKPLFDSFAALCMQTAVDKERMISLGIPESKVITLGNLKFDTSILSGISIPAGIQLSGIRIVAGSTHRGEEEILFKAYTKLKGRWQNLSLIIAPRDISRGGEIKRLADSIGLIASCRSQGHRKPLPEIHILDTIGELVAFYQSCDIAFVGGSLVAQGGHNPIEPAVIGVPVLFGPHMEDFAEIAEELIAAGGAIRIHDADSFCEALEHLLSDPSFRIAMGTAAAVYIKKRQGVISRHLELIGKFL